MGAALVVIEKERDGEVWANTWGVGGGADFGVAPTPAELTEWGAGQPFTTPNTTPGDPAYLGGLSILHSLVGFERLMHFNAINFFRIYVTDGKKNVGQIQPLYLSAGLDSQGIRVVSDPNTIAPGSITLLINRIPQGLGLRRGRIFYRGVLLEADIRFATRNLVDFTSPAVRTSYENLISASLTNSGLGNFIGPGAPPAELVGIPRYGREGTTTEGQLVGLAPLLNLVPLRPAARQVKRGRRQQVPV